MKERTALTIVFFFVAVLIALQPQSVSCQPKVEEILTKIKSYRYGSIMLYELKDISELREAVKQSKEKKINNAANDTCEKSAPGNVKSIVQAGVADGQAQQAIATALIGAGLPTDYLPCLYQLYSNTGAKDKDIQRAFALTTRPDENGRIEIIALLTSTEDESKVEKSIATLAEDDVFTLQEMKADPKVNPVNKYFEAKNDPGVRNTFQYVSKQMEQGAVISRSAELQGIGTLGTFLTKEFGLSESVARNEADISDQEVQQYMRISEGQPQSYRNQNEIIAGYDLLSWRYYEPQQYLDEVAKQGAAIVKLKTQLAQYEKDKDNENIAATKDALAKAELSMQNASGKVNAMNADLPVHGAELRYGIDDINYPSLWSERLALNYIWQSSKLGIILPTGSYMTGKSVIGQNRQLTHAGFGINADMDLPIKIIRSSGVFHLSGGFVLGDAKPSDYKIHSTDTTTLDASMKKGAEPMDYLVRFNASLLYSFAIKIDKDNFLRFKLGGSVFGVETWQNNAFRNEDSIRVVTFTKSTNQTFGGLTGRIEFMRVNASIPWGCALQYFDEALSGNFWLHIPLTPDTQEFALHFEVKGYSLILRDPRAWESKSVMFPSARFIWNF